LDLGLRWIKAFSPLEWLKYLNENPRCSLALAIIFMIFSFVYKPLWISITSLSFLVLYLFSVFPDIWNKLKFSRENSKMTDLRSNEILNNLDTIMKNPISFIHEHRLLRVLAKYNIQVFNYNNIESLLVKEYNELNYNLEQRALISMEKRGILEFINQGISPPDFIEYRVVDIVWVKLRN